MNRHPGAPKTPRERDPRCPAIGTAHGRAFKGTTLKLKALADGTFEFDAKVYASISGAARAASGPKTIDGFTWWKLGAAATKHATGGKAKQPKRGGEGNDIGTDAGKRAAFAGAELRERRTRKGAAKPARRPRRGRASVAQPPLSPFSSSNGQVGPIPISSC